jgi:hypothetical protein
VGQPSGFELGDGPLDDCVLAVIGLDLDQHVVAVVGDERR